MPTSRTTSIAATCRSPLTASSNAKLALNDIPQDALAAAEESLADCARSRRAAQGNTEAQTDLVVGLYKLAKVASGERKDAVIDEGFSSSRGSTPTAS